MAARKRESEGRNSDLVRLGARFDAGSCSRPKFSFGQVPFPFINSSQKSMISGSKYPKSKNLEIWNSGDPKFLFLESVIFLYKFFTKSVISGSKHPKSENSKICSCLLLLARAQPLLAHACP